MVESKYRKVRKHLPFPVTARSKAWFGGRSIAGVAVLNPHQGLGYVPVVSVVCFQVEVSALG
jgi:hypothetical protein